MADIDLKIQILQKSMSTFSGWLDQCEELIGALPAQLEQCDHTHLRELAMKYKDLLLQMKERCDYMNEVNSLCKEIADSTASEHDPPSPAPTSPTPPSSSSPSDDKPSDSSPPPSPSLNPRLVDLATKVKDLNTRFSITCVQAREHYSSLSKVMASAAHDKVSLHSFSFSLSSPTPERKAFLRGSGSFNFNGEGDGEEHRRSKRHKKSKGSKSKRRDRLSLSLDPTEPETSPHPLSRTTKVRSVHIPSSLPASSPSPPPHSGDKTDLSQRKSPPRGLTKAVVTDLDGLAWGGGGRHEHEAASVDSTLPSSADIRRAVQQSVASSIAEVDKSDSTGIINTSARSPAATSDSGCHSSSGVVLRRGFSLPEQSTEARRPHSGNIQFVRELGLVQIVEEGTRGLRPRSAVLLSDSEKDFSAGGMLSSGSGQMALLTKAMKRRSTDFSERLRSSSSMTLHSLAEAGGAVDGFNAGNTTGKGINSPLLIATKTGSLCDLPARSRLSFTSVDSLDPRPILGGALNSELSRIASSERTNSVEALHVRTLPEKSPVNGDAGVAFKSHSLLSPGSLDLRKSRSMDVLSPTGPPPKVSLANKLADLTHQLQEFIHTIAESKHCALQSLALELKLGEIKAMLTILEVQDVELLRLRALYSSDDLRRLEVREKERKGRQSPTWKDHSASYPVKEVKEKKEEIEKLTQRIALLKNHCEESIEQMEEVLEFVTQFEREIKTLKTFLASQTSQVESVKKKEETFSEETWSHLQLALTEINEHKGKMQSVQELSTHLLYLEPIFDGKPVRDDLQTLSNHFQNLVTEIFTLLETQAKSRIDQLLLELSVLSSWVTETELAVQALAKKTKKPSSITAKLSAMKESLDQDLQKKKESLLLVTEKIHPITAVLNPDESAALRDLIFQVDNHTKLLLQLENSLQVVGLDLKEHDQDKTKVKSDVQDSVQSQDSGKFRGSSRAGESMKSSEFDDSDGNYAEIDALREQILRSRSKVPAPATGLINGVDSGPQSNGSLNVSGSHHRPAASPSTSAAPPGLYERVEEVLPSPFADYDLVPSRSLDTAIEQLPRKLGPTVTLSQHNAPNNQSIYDTPTTSYYQSPRSSVSHSPSPSVSTPGPSYYQVPTSLLRQSHQHSLSTPSPIPPPERNSQASPDLQPKKGRYVEIDVVPDGDSLAIKKSSSAGSVSRLGGASPNHHPVRGKAAAGLSDYSEVRRLGEKPSRRHRSEEDGSEGDAFKSATGGRRRRKRKSKRGSLHEDLLQFISQEWASLDIAEISTQATAQEEARLDEAISCLESYEQRSSCVKFVNGVRDLETSINAVKEQISLIRTPRVPDLEQVHGYIDQCQKLRERITNLHPRLEAFNEESLSLVSSLGRSPTCSRVAQLMEIKLFDVSTLWHSSNMKLATCMSELRQREGEINSLHLQLRTISRALDEARGLLDKKLSVLNVEDYLNQCKTMQAKLGSLSEARAQVTSNIKGSVLHSPQLPVCQGLLDQLKQVDGQWINIFKELADVSQLEPILIKKMFVNISKEFTPIENMLKELEKQRTLNLTEAKKNCTSCQDNVEKLKTFKATLNSTDARLVSIIEASSLSGRDSSGSDDGMELSGVKRCGSNGSNHSSTSVTENGMGIQVEMVITQYGPELASVSHRELLKLCKVILQRTDKLLSEVEVLASTLQHEFDLLSRFYKDLEDLQLWASDTKSMLGSGSHSNGMTNSASSSASVAQLRGKHQAICQQVATRQPKMDTVQSLASEVLKLPSKQADKQTIKKQLTELYNDWDDICQQCVPAGAILKTPTPTGPGGSLAQFLSATDFEDEAQMIEWLILVESRLQPQLITVGDFRHLRRLQRELQMIESELQTREKDYLLFMKGFRASTLSISQCSDIFDPESSATKSLARAQSLSQASEASIGAQSKTVKFFDENTLERFQRHQDIGNGITFSDSGSKSSESDFANSLQNSVAAPGGGGANGNDKSDAVRSKSGRYHFMGPESGASGLHHHTSVPLISLAAAGSSQTSVATPDSPIPDDVYQLAVLWKGSWSTLIQQKKRLQAVEEAWKAFETKKEVFVNFLTKAEERLQSVFKVLSSTKDLAIMNAEFGAYLNFSTEVQTHSQSLSNLNDMSRDLLTNHHTNDDTHDLQDTMDDLNARWKKVMQSFTQHQPTITALHTRWKEFFRDYQSFLQWLKTMDLDMSNLNPFVKDMTAVRTQLEKLKEIQQELHVKEGVVESIRLHAHKLLQGVGGSHMNAAAIHARLDNMGRRWDHLQTLATERKTSLEQALTEKQDFLSRLADVLAWLNQAEKHLSGQKPLGSDYYSVHSQYQAQQGFWLEVTEQKTKIEAVIRSGRQVAMETQWPQGTGDSLRSQYSGLEERWKKLWTEAEQWGQLLQTVHPELEKFQTLCTECGQKLSDAELKMVKQEPVAKKMDILKQQYEGLQHFENTLLGIGDILEALVMSQKHQIQLSVKVSPELIQLVKRFHQRWNDLKQKVEGRHSAIDKALVKYDPVNLGVAELPYGWHRSTTESGTPYYINTRVQNNAQWHHPELSELYNRLKSEHNLSSYPSSAYPIALKLRAIQKRTQLNHLKTQHIMAIYDDHFTKAHNENQINHPVPPYEVTCLAVDMFQRVEETDMHANVAQPIGFYINSAVELSTCFFRDVFDVSHLGSINCLSLHIGIVCMSAGKLDEKYKALFNVISNGQTGIDMNQLTLFLEQVVQIPQSVCETQFCTLRAIDVCARECFRKYVGVGKLQLPQFVSWLQTEPPPLSWLPILHRLAASEKAHHPIKCSVCKSYPITGFRYRCVQCSGFDMCQSCYWSGKSGKSHDRSKHFMEEYCLPQKMTDNVFKSLQRSFRQKKNKGSQPNKKQGKQPPSNSDEQKSNNPPATLASKVGVDNTPAPPTVRKPANSATSSGGRHSAYVALTIGESPQYPPTSSSTVDDETHPGRRFTVTEDMRTAWQRGGAGGVTRTRPRVESPPPPPIPARGTPAVSTAANATMMKGKRYNHSQPPEPHNRRNVDASLSQLTEKNRNLSRRLSSLREHRSSITSADIPGRAHSAQGQEEDIDQSDGAMKSHDTSSTTEKLSIEEQLRKRNAYLQGRVDILQKQNRKLGSCITELRSFTDMQRQQQFARVAPVNISPNPYLLPLQNGGAHIAPFPPHAYHHLNYQLQPYPTHPSHYAPSNMSSQTNYRHGVPNPPPHHHHPQHSHHPHHSHYPHSSHYTHQMNGGGIVHYHGKTSPIPPPKFIKPSVTAQRSTSPVSQLHAPSVHSHPAGSSAISPPPSSSAAGGRVSPSSGRLSPVPGRISPVPGGRGSPHSPSRRSPGGGNGAYSHSSRHQTQL